MKRACVTRSSMKFLTVSVGQLPGDCRQYA